MIALARARARTAALLLAALAGLAVAGCASSPVAARPSPFPGAAVPASAIGAAVAQTALDLRGTPYAVGGNRPEIGFDCSGLVRWVFGQHQVTVPRTVAEQWHIGRAVPMDQLRAGDLVFFKTTGDRVSHVGIALSDGAAGAQFVHAPVSGGVVRVENVDAGYWRSRVVGVRRVGPQRPGVNPRRAASVRG